MAKTRKPKTKTKKAKPKSPAKTRTDIVNAMLDDAIEGDLTSRAQAERILDSALNAIIKFTIDGDRVFINHFGTFRRIERKGRAYRTPDVGKTVAETKDKITFTPSKSVKQNINS